MSLNNVQLLLASDDTSAGDTYTITNSLRLRKSATGYLNRTFGTPTSSTTWTVSLWFKRGEISNAHSHLFTTVVTDNFIRFQTGTDILEYAWANGSTVQSTAVFRDPSAWYHLVVAVDTTKATSSDRIRMYINGSEIAYGTSTYPTQNATTLFNTARAHYLSFTSNQFDGYVAEVNWIDGQQLTPSSFGAANPVTGVWRPKAYTGTYGNNGFYLPFSDNSALTTSSNAGLGKDFSGNGNYWTTTNISITSGDTYDSMTDVPTLTSETAANYPVLNRLIPYRQYADINSGNLIGDNNNVNGNFVNVATMAMPPSNGKFYWEVVWSGAVSIGVESGIADAESITSNSITGSGYTMTTNAGSVIGLAYDCATGVLTAYVNNVSQGTVYTADTTKSWIPSFSNNNTASNVAISVNFGQRPFAYTPPTGYVAINTYNLQDPAVGTTLATKPNKFMDATLYTGTGATQSITNAGGFKPDLVWMKSRSAVSNNNVYDSVRGVTKELDTNNTNAETTTAGALTAFNSNGWTIGNDTGVNTNGATYVGWQWQAGQGSTSSNTAGSITSTVSVNTTAGFSIVTYTGTGANATVGHGLGVAPKMIIVKRRDSATSWPVYHSSLTNTGKIFLESTAAVVTDATVWDTSPTSSVFGIGTHNSTNSSGGTYVAYCWAEIAGFSKFGSYTGNGSTNGTFVYLGFIPKFILLKSSTTAATNWKMIDSTRSTYNVVNLELKAESNAAEVTGTSTSDVYCDFLSNGFKLRGTGSSINNTGTFIYMAFAENPFKYSLAR